MPYLYFVGDGVPYNIFPVSSGSFTTAVSTLQYCCLGFEMVDQYGVPVTSQSVLFNAVQGGGSINLGDSTTDRTGMGFAIVNIGSQPGDQIFTATAGGLSVEFDGYALPPPAVNGNGVVNAEQ